MAQLDARIKRLESDRPRPALGFSLESLMPETRAAMAAAYGDTLGGAAPDRNAYVRALFDRLEAARNTAIGMAGLASGDLAAIIAAFDRVAT